MRMVTRDDPSAIGVPRAATIVLLALNCAMFGLCYAASNGASFSVRMLYDLGAIGTDTLTRQEYWRLLAYAFLHANVLHILVNMFCLVSWGGVLERTIGATYFLVVYLAAAVGGGIASILGHHEPFVTVGASGGISGLIGALLCLTVLGRLALSPMFFVFNIGLNVAIMTQAPQVDWMAHLGGFAAGLAACALVDRLEAVNGHWLACKVPEFAKLSLAAALASLGWFAWGWFQSGMFGKAWIVPTVLCGLAGIAAAKTLDLVLARNKGAAVAIAAATAINLSLPLLFRGQIEAGLVGVCRSRLWSQTLSGLTGTGAFDRVCELSKSVPYGLAALAAVATLALLAGQFLAGIRDGGFVGLTPIEERRRRSDL